MPMYIYKSVGDTEEELDRNFRETDEQALEHSNEVSEKFTCPVAVFVEVDEPPNNACTRPLVGPAKKGRSKSSAPSVKPGDTPSGG